MVLHALACLVLTGMVNFRDIDLESAFWSSRRRDRTRSAR
jgi:hypothetical protein